ncbi:hypothetical protein AMATHDRAFT_147133 [Amanita thiersii Skay4041]|uniref:AP-3 complex subunit delta n=1 Tax=Amanita thiersii Skay4041 TaxID=703135 RepID=A0A2A9NPS7_9AGAR|nr:hypothetical protein AMATHDRAFT_147133 [Amanita thiersii Skay4041]
MWERTLQDLIRGLRANKKDEAKFIAQAVDEIRTEIRSDDMELKAGAVMKLTYLDMLGYDMSWASFHVVEVMSSPKHHLKSVGYLGAVQSFQQDTDVLMLTTNLLKKDLSSTPADIAVTLNGLSAIVTPDLARDLSPELTAMLNHSRPHIRKRAVLAIYRICEKYPDAIKNARSRIEDKLDDADSGVVAATVNMLCELVRRNPQDYLTLAPRLFHHLTTSSNNWMLIKIVKIFGSLSPYEPRLVKKLQPPITELISTTPAISLLYECVHTCIVGGMLQGANGNSLARLCVSKLANFIQDPDQNLKYIALLAMAKIVPSHPHLVAEYQETILASVNDQDISIRMRALDLISAMLNRNNLQSIVQQLLVHLLPDNTPKLSAAQSLAQRIGAAVEGGISFPGHSQAYRLVLSQRILSICSQDMYDNVTNFEWYLSVLVDLAHVANVNIGAEIRDQLVDIVGRVRAARPYAVQVMYTLITDDKLLLNAGEDGSCSEILWAAAWICGEYCNELAEPQKLIPYLLRPEISNLAPDILAVYIQAAMKTFGFWAAELAQKWDDEYLSEVKTVVESFISHIHEFTSSPHIVVQERAAQIQQLFKFIEADLNAYRPRNSVNGSPEGLSEMFETATLSEPYYPKSLYLIQPLFSAYQLNPVARAAQISVPVPEGLDLDAWIVPPPSDPVDEPVERMERKKKGKKGKGKQTSVHKTGKQARPNDYEVLTPVEPEVETSEDRVERERRKAERLAQLRDDPYYIIDDPPSKPPADEMDSIPVVVLEGMPSLLPCTAGSDLFTAIGSSVLRSTAPLSSSQAFIVDKEGEMPERMLSELASAPRSQSEPIEPIAALQTSNTLLEPRTITPDPIRVTRAKKKSTGKKRKPTIPEP